MTTCPKANPNLYPSADPEAVALFDEAAKDDKAIPKFTPQEDIVKRYQQAADKGYWLAMHNLAMSYYLGDGIAEDHAKALYWFQQIEKLGIPEGYTDMSLVYQEGIGVEANPEKAAQYMIKAAQLGDRDAQFYLGQTLYNQQREIKIYGSYGVKLWQCAAEQGHKKAHFHLAVDYEVTHQLGLAYRYYLLGAKAGDDSCLRALSDAYAHTPKYPTFNLEKDLQRAICLEALSKKVASDGPNRDLTFPDLDTLCPGTVPQPNEMK